MARRNGSVIGVRNVPTSIVASGVWSLNEVDEAQKAGIWPGKIGTPVSLGGVTSAGSLSSVGLTTTAAVPAGATIVVGIGLPRSAGSISVSSMTDSAGNTYSRARTSTYSATNVYVVELWYCTNAVALSSGSTITATLSATTSSNPSTIVAGYVTGVAPASPVDKVNSTDYSPGTAYASGTSGTLSQANEIAFGFISGYTAAAQTVVTEGSGFTLLKEQQQAAGAQFFGHLGYQVVSATTALNYQPSLSVSAYGSSIISTFKCA